MIGGFMKKTNAKKLALALVGAGLIFGFFGCKQDAGSGDGTKTHTAKSTDLIKFRSLENVSYLATQFAPAVDSSTNRSARSAASTDSEGSLLAVVKDENGKETVEEVIEVPKKELELEDWCTPQPVREIYQCPYENVKDSAKGVYTVFAGPVDWWKYKDGTPAPNIGQIMYLKQDGSSIDILKDSKDDNVDWIPMIWMKEEEGNDYIQFDSDGNIFIAVFNRKTGKSAICYYCPADDMINYYSINVSEELSINNFLITKDGKWIFLNAMLGGTRNNVYALQVNSNAEPITLYEAAPVYNDGNEKTVWSVSSLGLQDDKRLFWYVTEYENDDSNNGERLFAKSGLYIATRSTNGSFSKDNVKRYYSILEWNIDSAIRAFLGFDLDDNNTKIIRSEASFYKGKDISCYTNFLDYLKSQCGYNGEIELNLSWFKDKKELENHNPWNEWEPTKDYSTLYAEDEDKVVLKNEAALKYLFETSFEEAHPESKDWEQNEWTEKQKQTSLWFSDWGDFIKFYHAYKINGDDYFNSETQSFSFYHYPLEYLMFKKGTTETAYLMDKDYIKSNHSQCGKGIILSNDEGVWVYEDNWDDSEKWVQKDGNIFKGNNTFARIFNLTDDKGNFTLTEPGLLSELNKEEKGFKAYQDFKARDIRNQNDPWIKKPFATNTNGFVAIGNDKKSIWYYSNEAINNLLEGTTIGSIVTEIYSFNLDDNTLICNATISGGGHRTISINLNTKESVILPFTEQLESMLSL